MKIRDIMRPGPFTISETDTLGTAQAAMTRARVRHLPVMSDGKLVGMLSERDVLGARARAEGDWWAITVHDAMRSPVQTAAPDDSLTEVAGRLAAAKIGAMPVVERGELLGLATVTDVLEAEVRSAMGPAQTTQLIAADAMTPSPFTVHPSTSFPEAVALMVEHGIRHLPVVDVTSTLVGMLSERDVRTEIGDPIAYVDRRSRSLIQPCVADAMMCPAISVPFDRPLLEVAREFADGQIGAVPVVDKFGALIGIVSYIDALRVLAA